MGLIWTTATISSVLAQVTPKGVQTFNAWIRDYPELMYVGLYLPNYFKDGGKLKRGWLTYKEQQKLSFKNLWAVEADMSINANEVTWYEAWLMIEESGIVGDVTASADIIIETEKVKYFKVGDVVVVKEADGSGTTEVQSEITAVDTANDTITIADTITAANGDRLLMAYNIIEYGTTISRGVSTGDVVPVTTYFQTFGESMSFNSNEINQARLLEDAQEYVKAKFSVAINMSNNRFARAFYLARNISWAKSETAGLEFVVNAAETKFGAGSAIIDFTGVLDWKAKAKKLVETINYFNAAPVYNGSETPTFFVNNQFISNLSEIMFDMGNYMTIKEKEIEFGLQSYSSPFFRSVQFIVSHTLNRLEPTKSVAYVFPKHLVTFKTPEYTSVTEQGALVKTAIGWYQVLKQPQTSVDIVDYTAQMRMANVFVGTSVKGSYGKIINL
jgi:hypothetical protein